MLLPGSRLFPGSFLDKVLCKTLFYYSTFVNRPRYPDPPRGGAMAGLTPPFAKITRPVPGENLPRTRLFHLIDQRGKRVQLLWICGPPGCGKTTLVSTYIEARKIPALWYRVDEGDDDPASFFYYLGLAGKRAVPRKRKPLPLLTPEYMPGIQEFTRLFLKTCFPGFLRAGRWSSTITRKSPRNPPFMM